MKTTYRFDRVYYYHLGRQKRWSEGCRQNRGKIWSILFYGLSYVQQNLEKSYFFVIKFDINKNKFENF